MEIALKQQLAQFEKGIIVDGSGKVDDMCYNFYDWFCKDSSLERKAKSLYSQTKKFVKKFNIDTENHSVFFKNNCPMRGPLYDDFRICDIRTGDVVWTVIPKCSHSGEAEIWGALNNFKEAIYTGKNLSIIYKNLN
jgi:hypothetical protein